MDKDKPLNTHINMLKSLPFDEGQQDPNTDYLNALITFQFLFPKAHDFIFSMLKCC